MASIQDPYFSGTMADKLAPGDKLGPGRPPFAAWLIVYLFNLAVPVIFGWGVTNSSGKVGMVLGILLVFSLGCCLCIAARWVVIAVVYGGWLVAISQLTPMVHIIAGSIGLRAASVFEGGRPDRRVDHVDSVLGGLVATLITGAVLLTVAAILGVAIRGLAYASTRRAASRLKP